jgi:predicted permease
MRGRDLADTDRNDSPRVVLINEAGVRQWFGDQDALGKRVVAGGAEREIVGIVSDVLERDPGQSARPMMFAPYAQRTTRTVRIVVRAEGDPLTLAPAIRREVHALDRNLPVGEVAPLDDLVTTSMARPRLFTSLLSLFAAVALALAATGIFGVLSYAVAQRSREISIRMALGAAPGRVRRMIVGEAMKLAAIGLAVGIFVALAAGRVMQSQLFGVSAVDPVTLAAVVLVLAGSAALASYMPARRAAALDPVTALREG